MIWQITRFSRQVGTFARRIFARAGLRFRGPTRESISYQIVDTESSGRARTLVDAVHYYEPSDVARVDRIGVDGRIRTHLTLSLKNEYALALVVERCPAIGAFGLVVTHRDANGFGWNGFLLAAPGIFEGPPGRVAVDLRRGPGVEEVVVVRFMDHTMLTFDSEVSSPQRKQFRLLLRQGSVLRFISSLDKAV